MDAGNVIINVNELKAACFDILVNGLILKDGGGIRTEREVDHYVAGMKKVFDLIEELGRQ